VEDPGSGEGERTLLRGRKGGISFTWHGCCVEGPKRKCRVVQSLVSFDVFGEFRRVWWLNPRGCSLLAKTQPSDDVSVTAEDTCTGTDVLVANDTGPQDNALLNGLFSNLNT
jgi:hypothetical protein